MLSLYFAFTVINLAISSSVVPTGKVKSSTFPSFLVTFISVIFFSSAVIVASAVFPLPVVIVIMLSPFDNVVFDIVNSALFSVLFNFPVVPSLYFTVT